MFEKMATMMNRKASALGVYYGRPGFRLLFYNALDTSSKTKESLS